MQDDILIVTSPNIEGYKIINYGNMIFAQVVIGTGLLSEISASISDALGGRSNKFEEKINSAIKSAISELKKKVQTTSFNALISTNIRHEIIGDNMVSIIATATPVKIDLLFENKQHVWSKIDLEMDDLEDYIYSHGNDDNAKYMSLKLIRNIKKTDDKITDKNILTVIRIAQFYQNRKMSVEAVDILDEISEWLKSIDGFVNNADTLFECIAGYITMGEYAKAEDFLDMLLKATVNNKEKIHMIDRSTILFRNLLELTDKELIDGNLPREELKETIEWLKTIA